MAKCHLLINPEPLQTLGKETGLCGAEIKNARSVMEVSGEISDVKDLVANYLSLCSKCRRQFLERTSEKREWLYFLAEGQVKP